MRGLVMPLVIELKLTVLGEVVSTGSLEIPLFCLKTQLVQLKLLYTFLSNSE